MTERDLSCFLFPKSFETACELGPGSGAQAQNNLS